MPKFRVTLGEVASYTIEVEAANAEAKVICMVDDLSRYALFGLLDYPSFTGDSSDYLRGAVIARLEAGRLSEHEIIAAWEDDEESGA